MSWNAIIGHDRPKKLLRETLTRSRLAHAYLFHGAESIGKSTTAVTFAQAIHCDHPESWEPCGSCRSCHAILANSHPDFSMVSPDGNQFKIDQVRAIQEALIYKPLTGSRKILILTDADTMNPQAANCFLKTLEEPPDHSLLILVTSRPNRLPATLLSRCQQVRFDPPAMDTISRFLIRHRNLPESEAKLLSALCLGQIGDALTADLDALIAERDQVISLLSPKSLQDLDQLFTTAQSQAADQDIWLRTLNWIQIWLRDSVLMKVANHPDLIINLDRLEQLSSFSNHYSVTSLLKVFSLLDSIQRSLHRNLNRTMVLESLLLELRLHGGKTTA